MSSIFLLSIVFQCRFMTRLRNLSISWCSSLSIHIQKFLNRFVSDHFVSFKGNLWLVLMLFLKEGYSILFIFIFKFIESLMNIWLFMTPCSFFINIWGKSIILEILLLHFLLQILFLAVYLFNIIVLILTKLI